MNLKFVCVKLLDKKFSKLYCLNNCALRLDEVIHLRSMTPYLSFTSSFESGCEKASKRSQQTGEDADQEPV